MPGGGLLSLSTEKQEPVGILSRVLDQLLQQSKYSVAARMIFRNGKTLHRGKLLTIHICEDIAWVDRVDSDTILSMQHGKVPGDLQTSTSSHITTLSLTTRCARQLALAMLTWEDTQQAVFPAAGRTLQI